MKTQVNIPGKPKKPKSFSASRLPAAFQHSYKNVLPEILLTLFVDYCAQGLPDLIKLGFFPS